MLGAPISSTPREGQVKLRDGPCGDCRRVLWVPGPRGQYSGKICFIDKAGIQDYGGRHMTKRSSYPGVKI